MRKLFLVAAAVLSLAAMPAGAQSLTLFFGTADLDPLAQGPTVRVLVAQSAARVPQTDVNAFDDFYLINGPGKLKVHFNGQLKNEGQTTLKGWLGNIPYSNHEISYDLQAAFVLVKTKFKMPNARAASVGVYKTVNTQQIVYSYAVPRTATVCRQYLFTPATGGMQLGLRANCYW